MPDRSRPISGDGPKDALVPIREPFVDERGEIRNLLDGLAGGDQAYFGTALALQVSRVLSRCESSIAQRKGHHV